MTRFTPAHAGAYPVDAVLVSEPVVRPVDPPLAAALADAVEFDTLARLSADAVLVVVDGRIVQGNQAATHLLAAPVPEWLAGVALTSVIHPDDVGLVMPSLSRAAAGSVPADPIEHRLVRADFTHVLVTSEAARCTHAGQPAVMLVLREAGSRHALERNAVQARAEALHARRLLASENAVLAQLASNASLSTVLRHLCLYVEQVYPNAMSAVLLLDAERQTLGVAAAPTLPASVELDDLIQAGMMGLLDALSRY
ncbi:bifunctional diguanylate cyclase/phosphodiesterase, partial [Ralstonia pseudosolanacearum]